jgi:ECF sigma factor
MTNNDTDAARAAAGQWAALPELLSAAETSADARDRVITLHYPELKRIAEAHMRRERPNHTLQATALVSEFFVHIARSPAFTTRTRAQFLMVASVAMRRLLVDYARARKAEKRYCTVSSYCLRAEVTYFLARSCNVCFATRASRPNEKKMSTPKSRP